MPYNTTLIASLGLTFIVACALVLGTLGLEFGLAGALAVYCFGGAGTLFLSAVLMAKRVEHTS